MSKKIYIKLPEKGGKSREGRSMYNLELKEFAKSLIEIDKLLKDKVTARGWCYLLEGFNIITKNQFNSCQGIIKRCRRSGYLPMDFVDADKSRKFHNVEDLTVDYIDPKEFIYDCLKETKEMYKYKDDVAFWKTQKYYIQMMVEKIDVLNLFKDTCEKYHIPIANTKGWTDLNSRYYLALRFKEAEEMGLQPVFLYYGDFDPAGFLISDTWTNNLRKVEKSAKWNPKNLIIDRFGLNYDFIEDNKILWIDNLTTGKGRNLGELYDKYKVGTLGKKERIYKYEIEYIEKYGKRKCEANAILPIRNKAIDNCEKKIKEYLGENPHKKYNKKINKRQQEVKDILEAINMEEKINDIVNDIEHHDLH